MFVELRAQPRPRFRVEAGLFLAVFLHLLPLPALSQTLIGKFVKDPVRPAPGHYFVSLARHVQPEEVEPLATALADQYHGVLEIVYLRGFRTRMSELEAIELSRDPRVEIVADYPLQEPEAPPDKFVAARTPGPGEYTVWLSYSPHLFDDARVSEIARGLTTEYGGEFAGARGVSIGRPHFSLKADRAAARRMAADERVHHVAEVDYTPPTSWEPTRVGPLEVQPAPVESSGQPPTVNGFSDGATFVRTPGIAVPERYHVILIPIVAADDVEEVSRRLAGAHNLRILRIRGQGFEAEGTEQDAKEISREAAVRYVTEHDRSRDHTIPPEKFVRGTDPRPGRYHVELMDPAGRPTNETVRRIAEELVARYGGTVLYVSSISNDFGLEATESIARSTAADPAVSVIYQYQHLYWNQYPEASPEAHALVFATPASQVLSSQGPVSPQAGQRDSSAPPERFLHQRGPIVRGRYFIVLLEMGGERGAEDQAYELARVYGGSIKRILRAAFEMEMSEEEARALSRDPAVQLVTEKPNFHRGSNERFRRSHRPSPGTYSVSLRERPKFLSSAAIRDIGERLTAKYGGSVRSVFELSPGLSISATEAQAMAMSEDDEVEYVGEDTILVIDP